MKKIRLAYRDDDRTPVIFCIKETARRHYDLDADVVQIKGNDEYEAALFDGSCDVIIEHLEYLYEKAVAGEKIVFFSAPSKGGGLELTVPAQVRDVADLKGGVMAMRPSGQPYAVVQWLRMMGLEKSVETRFFHDKEVGRWGQWKKVADGECIAAFMSPLYLPQALAAGLKVLDVPEIPIVGHYAQACLARYARNNAEVLRDYVKASIHAVCLMTYDRAEALKIVANEPMKRMKIADRTELERQFDSIVRSLKPKPYPTVQALANTCEIATVEYPGSAGINPLSLWDLHWVKELDDEGFIDGLIARLGRK